MLTNKTPFELFTEKFIPEPNSGCWLWDGYTDKNGYGRQTVKRKDYRAHRLSWEFYRGDIPDALQVLHKCDTPSCVNPDHLFLGTTQDNTADKMKKGRHRFQRGSERPDAKLHETDIPIIRQMLAQKNTYTKIASCYGVSISAIWKIDAGRTWKHV